jgi:dihydrofolate reductase
MVLSFDPIPFSPEPSRFPVEEHTPPLALIVAMTSEGVIGYEGGMPWHEPADLRYFRQRTMGHAILMGRVTFQSIGRPLPGRRNLILSQRTDLQIDGCEVFADLSTAIIAARTEDACPVIIGGAKLYAAALPWATRLYITEIGCTVRGDTFFPQITKEAWHEVERVAVQGQAGPLNFVTLARTDGVSLA